MKKFLSLALVLVMVMSLSIPAFANKPAWVEDMKNGNGGQPVFGDSLPKGLQDKAVIPYGLRKDQKVTVEEMEDLIEEVLEYIENLDVDSDDDGLDDGTESVELIGLDEAEEIALEKKDGAIVKMSFGDDEYEFEILFKGELFEIEIDAITGDFEIDSDDDDDDYDLNDVISYETAKNIALDKVDEDNPIIIKVELDMEEADDDDEDDESIYEIEILTEKYEYEVAINAFSGKIVSFEKDLRDDDDWYRNQDRYRAGVDGNDDEGMVSAIMNLIDRIEYELEKEEPKLGHYMFQLEQKFSILQRIYGEKPEKEDYTKDLEDLLEVLEDAKDNSIYDADDVEAIEDIIDEIEALLEDEERISKKEFEELKIKAEKYFDMLDDVIKDSEVKALVEEVKAFIFANDFGASVGEFSQNEAMSLLTLVFKYQDADTEDLEDYFKDLKLAYKKFKMSKLVAGDYLETLEDYKTDLEQLLDADLTESEEDSRDDLIELIEKTVDNEKTTLERFYEIEEAVLALIEQEVATYEEELDNLIEEVKNTFLVSYEAVDQDELRSEKMTLVGEYFVALAGKKEAETEEEFKGVYLSLEEAYDNFMDFLEE